MQIDGDEASEPSDDTAPESMMLEKETHDRSTVLPWLIPIFLLIGFFALVVLLVYFIV